MASVDGAYVHAVTAEEVERARKRALRVFEGGIRARDPRIKNDDEARAAKLVTGFLGESAFAAWCAENGIAFDEGYEPRPGADEFDFLVREMARVDVKTQDMAGYVPRDDYRCEVTEEQISRPIDVYVFAKLLELEDGRMEIWLVGWSTYDAFVEAAQYRPRGSFLKGRRVAYSKYDVTIRELQPMDELVDYLTNL